MRRRADVVLPAPSRPAAPGRVISPQARRSRGRPVVDGRTDTDGHNQPGAGASGVSPLGRSASGGGAQRLDTTLAEAISAHSLEASDEHRPRGGGIAVRRRPGRTTAAAGPASARG